MRPSDPPRPRKPLSGGRAPAPDSVATRLEEAEKALERVRSLHEAYFLGLERRAPEPERLDLQRRLNDLRRMPTSNTALKFRIDNLVQRHVVLSAHWNRTLREIEAGTYRRDILKAERHLAARAGGGAAPNPSLPARPSSAATTSSAAPPRAVAPPPPPPKR